MLEIQPLVLTLAQEIMEIDDEINPDDNLSDVVGMASIEYIELFVAIENKTGIAIPDDEFENLQTINRISKYIKDNS